MKNLYLGWSAADIMTQTGIHTPEMYKLEKIRAAINALSRHGFIAEAECSKMQVRLAELILDEMEAASHDPQ